MPRKSEQEVWLSLNQIAELADTCDRVIRRAVLKRSWRGARLVVRATRGRGGAAGKQHQVLLASLPDELQDKWRRQQPGHGLREKVAEHTAAIEDEPGRRRKKGRRAADKSWQQEEREARHAAFSRKPSSVQQGARRKAEAVRFFHSLSAIGSPVAEREKITQRETGVAPSTLRAWLRICRGLDPGDWHVALAPRYRGGQVEAPFSTEAREWIWTEFFRLTKPSLKAVYRRAVRLGKERGWKIPSYATVKRLVDREPHSLRVLLREGQEAFELCYPTQQRDYSQLRVHEMWCCDGRQADVFCRWPDGTISRPIVIAWLEVRSRVFLRFHLARVESADAVRLAFKDAAERYRAIPEHALLDNG